MAMITGKVQIYEKDSPQVIEVGDSIAIMNDASGQWVDSKNRPVEKKNLSESLKKKVRRKSSK